MSKLLINASIFPSIGSVSIKAKDEEQYSKQIDFPSGANLLYLKNIKDSKEFSLLTKYANSEQFSDEEIEVMLQYFINTVSRPVVDDNGISSFLSLNNYGIAIDNDDFKLIDEWIPYVKKETWECIVLDLLRKTYTPIIEEYNFNVNIPIDLGSWKTEVGQVEQSLLNSFRSAFMFTLIGFLYGDNRSLYSSFNDFFTNEFSKRIKFINRIWISKKPEEEVRYIPIFDSFYNMKGMQKQELIQMIHTILDNEQITSDDKEMIKNTLINGAEMFHKNIDAEGLALEQSLIKPVVNYGAELSTAYDDLKAARVLYDQKLYKPSVNRSYYAMMHALKALLENKHMLTDWSVKVLNVEENHKQLEKKLKTLINKKIINKCFLQDFKSVKENRWIADYNVSLITDIVSEDCLSKADKFLSEIKKLTA